MFTVIFKSARNLTLDVELSGGSSTFNVTGFILCSGIPSGFLIFYDILCSFLNGLGSLFSSTCILAFSFDSPSRNLETRSCCFVRLSLFG